MNFFVADLVSPIDPAYLLNRDNPNRGDVKDYVEKAWATYEQYCPDQDFQKKAQQDFNSAAWQTQFGFNLLSNGMTLKNPKPEGPDFTVMNGKVEVLIEAVAAKNGSGPDAVQG